MEFAKLENWNVFLEEEKKYHGYICTVDIWVTHIPFMLAFLFKYKCFKGFSYCIHGKNPIPEQMKYNTQV